LFGVPDAIPPDESIHHFLLYLLAIVGYRPALSPTLLGPKPA
jgi:hypothetical protein